MELAYRPNWPGAERRMRAFWAGEELDRPCIWVTAPRREPIPGPPAPPEPDDPHRRWTDMDYRLAEADARFRGTFFGGESVPAFSPALGPGSLAIHLGSEPVFMPTTVWFDPCLGPLESASDLQFDPDEEWWRWTIELTERALQEGAGKYLVGFPDVIEDLDVLASLRGSLELLQELIDAPDAVNRFQEQILELYFVHFDAFAQLIGVGRRGSVFCGFPVWAPGRMAKLQSDISAMLSPRMFRDFAIPYLRRQCQRLDQSFYHLDGPDAVCHLPALLEIEKLGGIQWTPGAAQPHAGDEVWWPMWHQIEEAGKRLFALGVPADYAPKLAQEFDRNLLYMSTHTASEEEAEKLVSDLE